MSQGCGRGVASMSGGVSELIRPCYRRQWTKVSCREGARKIQILSRFECSVQLSCITLHA